MGLFVSGGGGVPKSRLVAAATQAANVLKNTFFVNSNGARTEGTMKDDQGLTVNANVSATAQPGKVVIDIPERACYNTSSKLQIDDSQFGDAGTGDCITGKSMTSSAGFKVGGTMSDYSGQAKQASALDKNGTNIRMKVPNTGKYSTGSYLTYPASSFGNAGTGHVREGYTFTSSAGVAQTGTLSPITGASETYAERCGANTSVSVTNGAYYVVATYVPGSYDFGSIYGMSTIISRQIGCYRTKTSYEPESGVLTGYGQLGVFVGKANAGTIGITGKYGSIIAIKLW